MNFWVKFSDAQKVDKLIVEKVSDYIRKETEHKIQVGQLHYLSRYDSDKLNSKSLTELISIARHNANDISNNLLKDNFEQSKILGIMSICCNNNIGVNIEDLGFILSDDDNQYSIFKKTKFYEVLNDETKFPKYAKTNKIKKRFKESIAYFEERGFLKYDNNKYYFSHPNYYEVGKNLFFRKSFEEQKLNIEYLKKSIICINPTSSLFSCKQLVLVYNRINLNFRQNIKELMFLSNRSIFPAVEDFSSINLISIIDDIDNDNEKEKIINIINRGNTDSSSIRWHNKEIPFLCKGDNAEHYFGDKISEIEIEEIESKILNNVDVKLYDVWRFVNYYKLVAYSRIYNKFNANLINSLLYHEEVFIRKHVAKLFFLSKINEDEIFLIEKIFKDNHPTVVFYGIWGSFLNWNIHSSEIKDFIFNILKELFSKQEISIRANNLITNFSIDYSAESISWREFSERDVTELWNIWAEIFPIFFKSLPVNIFLNDGRYYDTMRTSMKYLIFNNGIKVFETWLDRIELRIQNKIEITDYEMAISDELLEFTDNDFEIRKELFKRILSNNNSIFCLYNLKLTIKYWNKLNTNEKNIVLNLIDSNREDLRWIKATVLAQCEIPKEIEVKIVGDINLYSLKPVKVLEILPAQLINDCLKIIYSQPYELEYLRPSYLSDFWKKMINYLLFYHVEPFFEICVKEFIRHNIFGNRSDNFLLWQKICLNSKNLNYLTYLVIYNISRGSIYINGTKKIINGLIYTYKERDEYETFMKIIASEIETLQQTSQKPDIIKILGKELILKDLYKYLFPDYVMKMLIEKRQVDLLEILTEENKSFRFFLSYIAIENVVDENKGLKNEIKSGLLSIPNEIDHIGETKKKELKEKYFTEVKIENWVV
ncbi:hypothetical protein SAMN05444481_113132 [Flavobacterium frigidimaris]|nr:hypothetical protein SAMN05444481_113132 [Flavobacterium frigidimaris]